MQVKFPVFRVETNKLKASSRNFGMFDEIQLLIVSILWGKHLDEVSIFV